MPRVSISNETKATLPRVAFDDIKEAALGKGYKLNVVVVSASRIKKLNTIYRDIEKPTDILLPSFRE